LLLLPAESKKDEYKIDVVSELEIKSAIDPTATPDWIIVILDACHAGAFGGDRRKAVTTDRFVRDLNDDYGVITLWASMAGPVVFRRKAGSCATAILRGPSWKAWTAKPTTTTIATRPSRSWSSMSVIA
jgi:hypothetical protein